MTIFEGLFAPESYANALPEVRAAMVNGCGTSGWKGKLVPDSIYGMCITPACNIHDWMYTAGVTLDDKARADSLFLANLHVLINKRGGWLKHLRMIRASGYYEAVHVFGHDPFFEAKDERLNTVKVDS